MADRVKAAADARTDSDFYLIARTDAIASHGVDAAIERARRFAEAGADILFVEAIVDQDEVGKLPQLLSQPLLVNIVVGGKTPPMPAAQLGRLGYSVVLYANATLQGAVLGMQRALGALRRDGKLDEDPALLAPFLERQRLVGKPLYDELEERYKDA